MHGFKGLIPRNLSSDEAMAPLVKKIEEYRRLEQQSTEIILGLSRCFESHFEKLTVIVEVLQPDSRKISCPYYDKLSSTYTEAYGEHKKFVQTEVVQIANQICTALSSKFINFSGLILNFQQLVKNYSSLEYQSSELAKKYFKSQKNLISNIDSYKDSFNEAKLIYNMDEKLKRYKYCEERYETAIHEHSMIEEFTSKMQERKEQIIKTYQMIEEEVQHIEMDLNIKVFSFFRNFNREFCLSWKSQARMIKDQKQILQELENPASFHQSIVSFVPTEHQEQVLISHSENKHSFFTFFETLEIGCEKQEVDEKFLLATLGKMDHFLERVRSEHKKIYDFHFEFFRILEKVYLPQMRDSYHHIEKNIKKYKETYLKQSYTSINNTKALIKVIVSSYEILLKRIQPKIQVAQKENDEMNKLFRFAMQETRLHLEKVNEHRDNSEKFNSALKDKILFLVHLINGFDEKADKIISSLKRLYNDLANDYCMGLSEIESLCSDYVVGKRSEDTMMILEIKRESFHRLKGMAFSEYTKEAGSSKISFEGDAAKNEDFKKLKKPLQIEIVAKKESSPQDKEKLEEMEDPKPIEEISKDRGTKHKKFLQSKITFLEDQSLIRTFSCAMADKIILQGKLHITSHRLCFSSKFNADNVFFGGTFIQVPLKDLLTLEKRKNGIFFDNSISLTTKNGEIFLTSFMRRNEAFDLLSSLIGVNFEDQAYRVESQDESDSMARTLSNQNHEQIQVDPVQEDDMKEQSIPERARSIEEKLKSIYPYKDVTSITISHENVTAYSILVGFIAKKQLTINRVKYAHFGEYFRKMVLNHKDIQVGQFEPDIGPYLNKTNIKSDCPDKFTRSLSSTIPVVNSGIPFMPKWAKTFQTQKLYIVSKHRWVIDSFVENTGAPYTDTFQILMRTICESNNTGCTLQAIMHVNFIKSTMMKGIIESKSHEQTRLNANKYFEEIKKVCLDQEKKKAKKTDIKKTASNSGEQEVANQNSQAALGENEDRTAELEEKIAKMQGQKSEAIANLQSSMTKLKIGLAASAILNIAAIIVIILLTR